MPTVDIPGVGLVEFPEDYTGERLNTAAKGVYLRGQQLSARAEGEQPASSKGLDALSRLPAGVQSGTGRTLAGAVRAVDIAATPTFIPFMGGLGPGAETINRLNQQMPAVREEFVRGRPQRLAESTAFQLGREIEQAAAPTFGVDPARDNEFLAQLATAAGEMVPTLAAGAVAGPAGVAFQYGTSAGEAQAQEAIAAGKPEAADIAFLSAAGLGGITEAALGVPGRLLAIANRARKAGVNPGTFGRWANRNPMAAGIARAGAEGALREGAQEGLEQAGQNLIASDVAGYAPDRPVTEGVGRSAALGAILGGLVGGSAAGLNQAQRNQLAAEVRAARGQRIVGYTSEGQPIPAADAVPDPLADLRGLVPSPADAPATPGTTVLPDGRVVVVNAETGGTAFPAVSPATPPTAAAPAPTAEVAPPALSAPPAPTLNPTPNPAPISSSLTLEPVADVPDVPGVPSPLEGQPYDTALRTRPEATMETRPAAPLGLQREPTVSPELADTIQALRQGYQQQLDVPAAPQNVYVKPEAAKDIQPGQDNMPIHRQNLRDKTGVMRDWIIKRREADERTAAPHVKDWSQYFDRFVKLYADRPFPETLEQFAAKYAEDFGGARLAQDFTKDQLDQVRQLLVRQSDLWVLGQPNNDAVKQNMKNPLYGGLSATLGNVLAARERQAAPTAPAPKTPPDQSGGPTELTPPAKGTAEPLSPAEVSEFNALEQARRAGTLDAAGATRYRELETRAGQGDLLMPAPPPLTPANVPTAAKVTPAQASQAANPKTEFNAKVAKEQKKFLLDAVDKALAEAPDTSPQEIQALWRASEHFAAKQKLEDYTKANPYPTAPNRYEFGFTDEELAKFEAAKQAHALAIAEWEQRRDAELAPLAASYVSEIPFLTGKEHQGSTTELALRFGAEAAFMRSLPHVTIEVPGDGVFSIINTKDAIREFKERAAKFPTTAARAKAPTQARTGPSPVPALGELTKENVLNAAALAMSTDPDRAIINTVWSDGKQTVATDGRRLHWFAKGIGGTVKKPAIVDAKGKPVTNLDRDYPNWQQVRPDKAKMEVVFAGQDAGKLWTVLKQAQQMVEENDNSILLWWNRDRTLGISSASPDAGTYEHNVQPKAKIMTALDPQYVMDALAAARGTGSERVDILWNDDMSPVVIQAPGFEAVIMPMRLSGPSPIFDPERLTRYDLAATPETRRAMMKKDLAAIQRLGRPTGTEEVKAKWLKEQLGEVDDFAAEIARLEAKRKKEAAKPRTTAQKAAAQQRINAELQAEIDRLKALQKASSPSAVDSAIAALEAAKVKPGGLYALPDLGLTVTLWNGTLTAAQVALRAGRTLAQAVQAGVDWLRAQGQAFDEGEVRKALEQGLLQAPGIREHVGKRLLQEDFSPAAKAALEPLLRYEVKPDAQLFAEAAAVVDAIGPMEAEANYFGNPWGLPADAHVVLGFAIGNGLSTLEAQARAAGDTALADRIGRQNAEFQSQFVLQSTETARTLRAYRYFDLVGNLSPFTADLFARKVIEQASQKQKQRIKPALDKGPDGEPGLTDRLNEINRAGINEAARAPEVQGTARTAINQAIEEEARTAGTPVQQAIAAEVVAQLQTAGRLNAVEAAIVREHFGQNPEPLALADKLERAGVKPAKARAAELEGKYKDGVEAFRAKLRQKLAEARKKDIDPATLGIVDRAIRQRLAELQVKLGALVRQHWTEQERVGRTLAESLVQEAGLPDAQATRLADAIQRRFKALVQARKEQALRNLAKTPAARELQKPSVAQRIIEATNLGALDSEGLWQAVADKLGLPTYTAEASAEVKRLADRAQQLPEGSVQRQEATARLMRFIARQKGVNLGDLGWAFWYANTLSGPITHAVNAFSNVLSLAGNVSTQFRDVRGIPQILAATAKGFRTGLTEARAIVKQGPGANRTKFTEQGQALENLDPQDFTGAGLVSQWRYVARALAASDAAFYFPAREAKAITLARALARQEGKTGAAIRTRAQQILDGTEEQQNLWGAQVDRERAQLVAMGEKPDALWTTRRLEQLREQGWGADIGEAADDFALRTTYNNRPYGLIGTLADVAKFAQNRVPGARGVVPFVNVVANVVNDSINYTPWGFARAYAAGRTGEPSVTLSLPFEWAEKLREGKSPMTPDAVVDLHAKAALGTAMVGSLMAMALAGLDDDDGENFQLYGSGPKDAAAKAALRETGWLPYSVRVNGTYVSFANTPLAIPLGALGHYLDAARYDKRFEQADAFNRLGVALWGGAHIITQQSFLDGLARLLGALEERRGRIDTASDRAVEQAFRSISSVAVPNALRQLDRLNDPKIYDARGIEGALVAAIPFARRAGSPALNAFGEPITNEPWKRFASDAEANVWTDLARRKIYPSVADKAKNANGREMTDDEHYRYVQESGQAIKRRLETPGMRQMIRSGKEEDARKAVTAIVREERERARRRLGF